jgi:hypothetical protein
MPDAISCSAMADDGLSNQHDDMMVVAEATQGGQSSGVDRVAGLSTTPEN